MTTIELTITDEKVLEIETNKIYKISGVCAVVNHNSFKMFWRGKPFESDTMPEGGELNPVGGSAIFGIVGTVYLKSEQPSILKTGRITLFNDPNGIKE